MTYEKFVKLYNDPDLISDEDALEGAYYIIAVFEALSTSNKCLLGLLLAETKEENKSLGELSPIWIKFMLAILANLLMEQGRLIGVPSAHDTIPRSKSPVTICPSINPVQNTENNNELKGQPMQKKPYCSFN